MFGTEHLLPDDHVIVFYSETSPAMEQRHLWNIQNSGCGFETYRLVTKRRNGLDFYIATKVGGLFGAGLCNRAVLVSCDHGFQAIRDFWQECSGTKNRVAVSDCIEQGILSSGENSKRADLIRSYRKRWTSAISMRPIRRTSKYGRPCGTHSAGRPLSRG